MLTLNVTKRDTNEDLDALRGSGKIPAVFYGKIDPSTPISVDGVSFIKVFKEAGESSVIKLEGDGISLEALVKDVDFHPVSNKIRHVDFYVFEKGKKMKIDVPVEFTGVSPAVKDLGGTLVKVLYELEVETVPSNIPHEIKVDISSLTTFGSVIHVSDVNLSEGVTMITNGADIVASVAEPKEEVEEAPAAIDLSQIEVAKKGKEAKEGEEGAPTGEIKEEKPAEKKK